eukprot:Nk52_evm6s521 gene=Nk52_evmTU6s521
MRVIIIKLLALLILYGGRGIAAPLIATQQRPHSNHHHRLWGTAQGFRLSCAGKVHQSVFLSSFVSVLNNEATVIDQKGGVHGLDGHKFVLSISSRKCNGTKGSSTVMANNKKAISCEKDPLPRVVSQVTTGKGKRLSGTWQSEGVGEAEKGKRGREGKEVKEGGEEGAERDDEIDVDGPRIGEVGLDIENAAFGAVTDRSRVKQVFDVEDMGVSRYAVSLVDLTGPLDTLVRSNTLVMDEQSDEIHNHNIDPFELVEVGEENPQNRESHKGMAAGTVSKPLPGASSSSVIPLVLTFSVDGQTKGQVEIPAGSFCGAGVMLEMHFETVLVFEDNATRELHGQDLLPSEDKPIDMGDGNMVYFNY